METTVFDTFDVMQIQESLTKKIKWSAYFRENEIAVAKQLADKKHLQSNLLKTAEVFVQSLIDSESLIVHEPCFRQYYQFIEKTYEKLDNAYIVDLLENVMELLDVRFVERKRDLKKLFLLAAFEMKRNGLWFDHQETDIQKQLKNFLSKNDCYFSSINDFDIWYVPQDLTIRLKDNRSYFKENHWHTFPIAKNGDKVVNPCYYYICPLCGLVHSHGYVDEEIANPNGSHRVGHCRRYSEFKGKGYFIHPPKGSKYRRKDKISQLVDYVPYF